MQYPSTSFIFVHLIFVVSDFAPHQPAFYDSDIHLYPTLFINSTHRSNVKFLRRKLFNTETIIIWNTNDQGLILKLMTWSNNDHFCRFIIFCMYLSLFHLFL